MPKKFQLGKEMNFCEEQEGVDHVIAMATNSQLKLRAGDVVEKAKKEYEEKLFPVVELMEGFFSKNEDLEKVRKLVPDATWFRSIYYQTETS